MEDKVQKVSQQEQKAKRGSVYIPWMKGTFTLPEHPTQYEATLIKAGRMRGYTDEQIAEMLEY